MTDTLHHHSCIFTKGRRGWAVAFLFLISIDMLRASQSTCSDLLFEYIAAGKNCSAESSGLQFPYINLTVDCHGEIVVWNFTQQAINAGLENIVEVLVDYNMTNKTTGEVVGKGVLYRDWQSLATWGKKIELDGIEMSSNFTYTFGACMILQDYHCWVFNEHRAECKHEPPVIPADLSSPVLFESTPTIVVNPSFYSFSLLSSPAPVISNPPPQSSTVSAKPLTTTATSFAGTFEGPTFEGPTFGTDKSQTITIVAIVFPVLIIISVFGLSMLLCLIMGARSQRPLGAKWHFKEVSQFMKEKEIETYGYRIQQVGTLSTSVESISTIFEAVDFTLLKEIPPANIEETVTAHRNDNTTKQAWHEEKTTNNITPQTTSVDTAVLWGPSESSRKRNASEVSMEGYLKITQAPDQEDDVVFTEVTSDLDRSINMCNADGYIPDSKTTDAENIVSRSARLNNEDCSSTGTSDDGYLYTNDSSTTTNDVMNESNTLSRSSVLSSQVDNGYLHDCAVTNDDESNKSSSSTFLSSFYTQVDDGYLHSSDNCVTNEDAINESSKSSSSTLNNGLFPTPMDDGYLHSSNESVTVNDNTINGSNKSTPNEPSSIYIPMDNDDYLHSSDSINVCQVPATSPDPNSHSHSVHEDLPAMYNYNNEYLPPDDILLQQGTTMYSSSTNVESSPQYCSEHRNNVLIDPPSVANSDPYISTIDSTSNPCVRYTTHQPIPKTLTLPVLCPSLPDNETPMAASPRTIQDYLHDDGYSTSDAYTPDDREFGRLPRLTRTDYMQK